MQIRASNEKVIQTIHSYASRSQESRQVARRLRELLPARLQAIKARYAHQKPLTRAERQALLDPDYQKHLSELLEIRNEAMEARVQYETHLMLFYARQSLRAFHRRR